MRVIISILIRNLILLNYEIINHSGQDEGNINNKQCSTTILIIIIKKFLI